MTLELSCLHTILINVLITLEKSKKQVRKEGINMCKDKKELKTVLSKPQLELYSVYPCYSYHIMIQF